MSEIVDDQPLAYPVERAAKKIGVSRATLWRLRKAGRIQFRSLNGKALVTHAELMRFLESLPHG